MLGRVGSGVLGILTLDAEVSLPSVSKDSQLPLSRSHRSMEIGAWECPDGLCPGAEGQD